MEVHGPLARLDEMKIAIGGLENFVNSNGIDEGMMEMMNQKFCTQLMKNYAPHKHQLQIFLPHFACLIWRPVLATTMSLTCIM